MKFIGRKKELESLGLLLKKKSASLVVIRGRRRVGKSRLIKEFVSGKKNWIFSGLPPVPGITKQRQLDTFSTQTSQNLSMPKINVSEWIELFSFLGNQAKGQKIVIVFDEISWMGSQDPTFLGKIKNLWDQHLKKNDQLVFIVCGSASAWIEKNILSSKGFVGRISFTLTLEELPLSDCNLFWPKNISSYEKLKVLAVTGGIPKYLEEINPKVSAEENIKRLCFTNGAILVEEFSQIFSDLFLRDSPFYKKIVETLISGPKEREEIGRILRIGSAGGRLSEYLQELELAGFITRDHTWKIASGVDSKLRKYRLSDNYIRFYLKYTPSTSRHLI